MHTEAAECTMCRVHHEVPVQTEVRTLYYTLLILEVIVKEKDYIQTHLAAQHCQAMLETQWIFFVLFLS